MELVYQEYLEVLSILKPTFRRNFIDEIDWNEPLSFIVGSRGVGKTILILQHIKEKFGFSTESLYISLDNFNLSSYTLIDLARNHVQNGGTHLFVDEVHKYPNWSIELKNIRDKFRDLKVVASGSSILDIHKGNADLSRRSVVYNLNGLSFREYLNIQTKLDLPILTFEDIITGHQEIALDLSEKFKPIQHFNNYLKYGYYPFYLEGLKKYHHKLMNVINVILEQDMALLESIELGKIPKIRKLIHALSTIVPYQINMAELTRLLEINKVTLSKYLIALEKAEVLILIRTEGKPFTQLSKPEKVYLQNTNLLYLSNQMVDVGTLRETFFINQVSAKYRVTIPKKGDFKIDEKYTIEVGGPSKDYKQIAGIDNSYLALDQMPVGINNKIPLWMFGFLY